jgi:hypothetical protein
LAFEGKTASRKDDSIRGIGKACYEGGKELQKN